MELRLLKNRLKEVLETLENLIPKKETENKPIKNRVFLGGTTNETTWRDEIIPKLDIDYFNPVVDDWTEDCIKIEDDEKENKCNIHLYVITPEMLGVYSIAEAVQSSLTPNKKTLFCLLREKEFKTPVLKSLKATMSLLEKNGASLHTCLDTVVSELNSLSEDVMPMMSVYPVGVVDSTEVKLNNHIEKQDKLIKERELK